jgi:hypothetical protein
MHKYSKGFTRIWFALSLSWIIGVVGYNFDDINNPKIAAHSYLYSPKNKDYIDITGEDELIRRVTKDKNYDAYNTPYRESYFYSVEQRETAIDVMIESTLEDNVVIRRSQYQDARIDAIWKTVIFAAAPILAMLMIGFFVIWVIAGFKRAQPPKRHW